MQWLRDYRYTLYGLLAVVLLQVVLYPYLPDPMPTHWNADGVVDATLPKPWGVWILPLVFAPTALFLCGLPALSPPTFSLTPMGRIYRALVAVIAGFGVWITGLVDLVALGYPIDMLRQLVCALGVLLVIVGNWMGKLSPNFFMGIRTPWTLADPTVWHRTHRLGGPLWVVAGLGIAVTAVAWPRGALGVFGVLGGAALVVPIVYSWWISPRADTSADAE
jgi:uncharacterized membrane protein